jgi:hypothetical protein
LLADPARADSAGTDEVVPPLTGMVDFSSSGLWRTVPDAAAAVVRVYTGNDDDDDSVISEIMELGTGAEREIGGVAIEVELPTAVLSVSPVPDVCTSATTGVAPGVLVVRTVGGPPSWSWSGALLL